MNLYSNLGSTLSVVSVTSNYTATKANDLILCSGGTFTVSLYTAIGNAGKVVRIQKTDPSLTNLITIDPFGSETIGGYSSWILATNGDTVTIVSTGTGWSVIDRSYDTSWSTFTPTGSWTNSVVYTGAWRRDETSAIIRTLVDPATSAQTGHLTFTMPAGMTMNTAVSLASSGNMPTLGSGIIWLNSGNTFPVVVGNVNSVDLVGVWYIYCGTTNSHTSYIEVNATTDLPFAIGSAHLVWLEYEVPIVNWM